MSMEVNLHRVEVQIGGRTLAFETGKLAKQSNGAVVVFGVVGLILAAPRRQTRADDP